MGKGDALLAASRWHGLRKDGNQPSLVDGLADDRCTIHGSYHPSGASVGAHHDNRHAPCLRLPTELMAAMPAAVPPTASGQTRTDDSRTGPARMYEHRHALVSRG